MPELPEVETLVTSLKPYLIKAKIKEAQFFREDLREKIPIKDFNELIVGKTILEVFRRSKYILLKTQKAFAIFHLGMSGRFKKDNQSFVQEKHTHAIFTIQNKVKKNIYLHYIDPRRFGIITIYKGVNWQKDPHLISLGVEPLIMRSLGKYLWQKSRNRIVSIKSFLMNANIVVGIGNIYCCESLYLAGINPHKEAKEITQKEYDTLARSIKKILKRAIKAGGTTLKDFYSVDNKKGYFFVNMKVYGRTEQPCKKCKHTLMHTTQSGRSTWYCDSCQK